MSVKAHPIVFSSISSSSGSSLQAKYFFSVGNLDSYAILLAIVTLYKECWIGAGVVVKELLVGTSADGDDVASVGAVGVVKSLIDGAAIVMTRALALKVI